MSKIAAKKRSNRFQIDTGRNLQDGKRFERVALVIAPWSDFI